jgi:hypothetical protein
MTKASTGHSPPIGLIVVTDLDPRSVSLGTTFERCAPRRVSRWQALASQATRGRCLRRASLSRRQLARTHGAFAAPITSEL